MNKALFFTALLTTINYTTQTAAQQQCIPQEIERYEVSMRYVDYDEVDSADLPPREGFNLNEKDQEDQALEYRDKNDDIIITIKRNFIEESTDIYPYVRQPEEEVQILDDTGLYASHFLLQDLIRQATENEEPEIDPNDDKYKKQIAKLTQQLKKLKILVNKVASKVPRLDAGKDAEDIEDNIGDEWWEDEDGVLDILAQNPVDIIKLSRIWATLLQNTSNAKDIGIQAFQRTKHPPDDIQESKPYSSWKVLGLPGQWKYTTHNRLVPATLINASQNKARPAKIKTIGEQLTERRTKAMERAARNNYFASGYDAGPLKAFIIDTSRSSCHSIQEQLIVDSSLGQPRNFFKRHLKKWNQINPFSPLKEERKASKSVQ